MLRLWRALRQLLPLLPPSTRWFLLGYAVLSALLAVVDILALSLLALTLAPMVQGRAVQLPLLAIGVAGMLLTRRRLRRRMAAQGSEVPPWRDVWRSGRWRQL